MKIIEADNFSFRYKNSSDETLRSVSFEASEGELVLVCGATACGKTTLLKSLKPELAPYGEKSGSISFCGEPLENVPESVSAAQIGYVMQRPENQTVTDSVRGELAFGGESLGLPQNTICRQVAEAAAYFGLEQLLDQKTALLSGGQRQLLNLASVMAVGPRLIILDEPTAQLDPIAAGSFIRTLYRITRELAVTVIIAEHRFDELLPLADKVLLLERGRASVFDTPENAAKILASCADISPSLPTGLRIWNAFDELAEKRPPLTLGESRNMLEGSFGRRAAALEPKQEKSFDETAIRLKNVYFTYDRAKPDVVCGASIEVKSGEAFTLLGSNGSGKSTLLSLTAGIEKPYRGKIEIEGRPIKKYSDTELYNGLLAYLPQDVQSSFLRDSVGEELGFAEDSEIYDFKPLYDMHPYDLSGGQQQLLGIKKLLMTNPKIILLDEPTKGLDGSWRNVISDVIKSLLSRKITVFTVTHDTELAAMISDRCGIFFDGVISACGSPEEMFCGSMFYTTGAVKASRGIYSGICTAEQLLEICRRNGLKEGSHEDNA
ncbi:MAG: ATP-binding cassette domain-containing protein [Ruminococcus sp.]|nr:ATP-binding cassette domain-containing protein [Ruminococcus sp.]